MYQRWYYATHCRLVRAAALTLSFCDALSYMHGAGDVAAAVRVEDEGDAAELLGRRSSCCMDRGNCSSREAWRPYGGGEVGLLYVDVQGRNTYSDGALLDASSQPRPRSRSQSRSRSTSTELETELGVPPAPVRVQVRAHRVGFNLIAGEGNVQHSPPTIRACQVGFGACP